MHDDPAAAPARTTGPGRHHAPAGSLASRSNWLRAGVLGANDGIVSTAGLVVGVAGATAERATVLIAGLAGLVAGALSMAGGEYVSVSTQSDSERAALVLERWELDNLPDQELEQLVQIYQGRGLSRELAVTVAQHLTQHDALAAHAEAELGISAAARTNPWHAAGSSLIAFTIGALLPLLAIVLPPVAWRVPVTILAVAASLVLTGAISAHLGRAPAGPAIVRNVGIGLLAMAITFALGALIGGVT